MWWFSVARYCYEGSEVKFTSTKFAHRQVLHAQLEWESCHMNYENSKKGQGG